VRQQLVKLHQQLRLAQHVGEQDGHADLQIASAIKKTYQQWTIEEETFTAEGGGATAWQTAVHASDLWLLEARNALDSGRYLGLSGTSSLH